MKKKKIIATIIIIIAVGLLTSGGLLLYQNYYNMNKIVTSFKELKQDLKKTFDFTTDNQETPSKQTIIGTTKFNINPIFGNNEDETGILINNLNNTTFNYEYKLDKEIKKLYFNGSLLLNANEVLGINLYQNKDISYILFKNIFDKYITIEDNDIFKYLENSQNSKEDIKVSKENKNKKISLELKEKRLNEISKNIVKDLKNDDKAKKILGSNIENIESNRNNSNSNNSNNVFTYSIYLNKNKITTYEFNVKEDNNQTIKFNKDKETSIILEENNNEIFKGIIKDNKDSKTIQLYNNKVDMGTITFKKDNINISIIVDPTTNSIINANIATNKENNIITTKATISISTNGTNIDILNLVDTKTITEGVADFSNINTTNNVNINNLNEEDITTIEDNLITIIYSYFGMSI